MEKNKVEKLNKIDKIKLTPILVILFLISLFIGIAQHMLQDMVIDFAVSQMLKEAIASEKYIYTSYLESSPANLEELNAFYEETNSLNSLFVGMRVEKNGELMMEKGEAHPSALSKIDLGGENDENEYKSVRFNTEAPNNAIYSLSSRSVHSTILHPPVANRTDGNYYQDVWFREGTDGDYIYLAYRISLSEQEMYVFIIIRWLSLFSVFLVFIAALIAIVRVFCSQMRLYRAYYYDKVTGGYNLNYLTNHAYKGLVSFRKKSKGHGVAIAQISICKYKQFLACYGEAATDALLKDCYEVISGKLPKKAIVARYERGDYAIYLPYNNDLDCKALLQDILDYLPSVRPEHSLQFHAGLYIVNPEDSIDVTDAYIKATLAGDASNRFSERAVTTFSEELRTQVQWENLVRNDLDRALENEEFEIYLQPKYSCSEEKIAAAEALVRWMHPTEGFLTPYRFIPILENSGLIGKLDDYMISHVAKIQADLISMGINPPPISVNLSRAHFTKNDLAEHIRALVDQYNVPHELIEIELTESVLFDDQDFIIKTIKELQNYGFGISLDDFGSGYSSLNSLYKIPIDVVKIDAGFFRDQTDEKKSNLIVSEIIDLAKKLNIKVVAEGIEERSQVDFLKETQCDLIQGYYFAKPIPLSEYIQKELKA